VNEKTQAAKTSLTLSAKIFVLANFFTSRFLVVLQPLAVKFYHANF